MNPKKRLFYKFFFIIILAPVVVSLFFKFFSESRMQVAFKKKIENCQDKISPMSVQMAGTHFSTIEKNQIKRARKKLKERNMELKLAKYPCFPDTSALYLIDENQFLRGVYTLKPSEIDRLVIELDIIRLNLKNERFVTR